MYQEKSWARVEGLPGHGNLVAQIYFPLNSDKLDSDDMRVLSSLAHRYQVLLMGQRIELTFVGNADHRGNASYNRQLGLRRARSTKDFVDQTIARDRYALYSSQDALSRGEQDAVQGKASKADMALDRRVDIYANFLPKRRITLPPLQIVGTVPAQRLSQRVFSKSSGKSMQDIMNPDPIGNSIDNIIMTLGTRGEHIYGLERKGRRKSISVPITHRVNAVKIHTTTAKIVSTHEVSASDTTVTYEWGPPKDTVTVTATSQTKDLRSGRTTHAAPNTKVYSRSEVENNAVIFPPDPN